MREDYERHGQTVPDVAFVGLVNPVWRDPHDQQTNDFYDRLTQIDCEAAGDPGMTMQAPAEEQDINVIMKRFGVKDGSRLPRWQDPNAMYGDFSEIPNDPVEAAEYIRRGDIEFQKLPAELKNRFITGGHLWNWLTQESNKEEAYQLGLLERPPAKEQVSTSTSSDKE